MWVLKIWRRWRRNKRRKKESRKRHPGTGIDASHFPPILHRFSLLANAGTGVKHAPGKRWSCPSLWVGKIFLHQAGHLIESLLRLRQRLLDHGQTICFVLDVDDTGFVLFGAEMLYAFAFIPDLAEPEGC